MCPNARHPRAPAARKATRNLWRGRLRSRGGTVGERNGREDRLWLFLTPAGRFVSDVEGHIGKMINGLRVISYEDLLTTEHRDRQVVVALSDGSTRRSIVEQCERDGFEFSSVISASHRSYHDAERCRRRNNMRLHSFCCRYRHRPALPLQYVFVRWARLRYCRLRDIRSRSELQWQDQDRGRCFCWCRCSAASWY